MPEILIDIRNKTPAVVGECRSIVADNTDYTIHFTFDDDWTSLSKTVLFVLSDGYAFAPVETENNFVTVPKIVTDKQIAYLFVGVRQGDVMTTRPCPIVVQESISTKIKDDAVQPDPSMWEDVISRIEKLEKSGGTSGGGTSDAVQYVAQTLTDDQKAQARENIGAQIADIIININSDLTEADKTYAEIEAAYNAGANLAVFFANELYTFVSDEDGFIFEKTYIKRDTIRTARLIIFDDGDYFLNEEYAVYQPPVGITARGDGDAIVITIT